MRVMHNGDLPYAIHSKFGDKFLASLTKSVLEPEAGTCFTVKEYLLLHCHKILAFVVVAII